VFFISDFQAPDFSQALAVSGRRHDFVAIHIHDERERALPNVGIITLEDAETGDQVEINTADRTTRARFTDFMDARDTELSRVLRAFASRPGGLVFRSAATTAVAAESAARDRTRRA